MRLSLAFASALLLVGAAGCGKSGSRATRPIEVIYYVNAPEGTRFQLLENAAPRACGSSGIGIQAANAQHLFGDRVFRAPHFFVDENADQPVRGVFVNVDESANAEPITVDLFLGPNLQASTPPIFPGECDTVGTVRNDTLEPVIPGDFVRIEVCARPPGADTSISCDDEEALDARVSFFASLGDLEDSNLTNCNILPVAESCRTPATFFIEDPQEVVSAVFDKLSDQNRDATMRAELYINGRLEDTDTGKNTVIVQTSVD